jgi:hypothetical protein
VNRTAQGIPVVLEESDNLVHRADARKAKTTRCGKWWHRLAQRTDIATHNRCSLCWELPLVTETTGGV